VGTGSTFELYLPSTEEPTGSAKREIHGTNGAKASQHKTVLVVEDEREVRELASAFLTSAGYSVLTAEDGVEALETAGRLGVCIDAVLTDMVMPRLGGAELGIRLKSAMPRVKVIYMSGYLEPKESGGVLDLRCFLQKPFSRDALVEKVGQALKSEIAVKEKRWEKQQVIVV
jgi:CheY-like chemotaxis protein